jgi:HK97 gp10 family phage protein
LKSSITYEVVESLSNIIGIVGTNVEYAPYQEFGTSNMQSQPFLLPALYESKADIMKIFEDVLKSVEL